MSTHLLIDDTEFNAPVYGPVAFYDGQPREAGGRFGVGKIADHQTAGMKGLRQIAALTGEKDGGFTYHMVTGHQPSAGFAVSIYKGHENVLSPTAVTPKTLAAFAVKNWSLLSQKANFFGAWHNPKDGKVYLDISKVVGTKAEATRLGRDHSQKAIFDIRAGKSVKLTDPWYSNNYGDTHEAGAVSDRTIGGAADARRPIGPLPAVVRSGADGGRGGGRAGGVGEGAEGIAFGADWDESKHPRGEHGKFGTGDGEKTHGTPTDPTVHQTTGGPAGERGGGVSAPAAPTSGAGRPDANPVVRSEANAYNAAHGLGPVEHPYIAVDQARAGRIADAYDALPHDDSANPAVKEAYEALAHEVDDQYAFATAQGMHFEPWKQDGQPYQMSSEMAKDVADNRHLYFYSGGEPHAFLSVTDPQTGLSANEKFRAVHDYFGHAAGGYGFGARGEENAWIAHSQMFSPAAQRALTTETRGQNSWVNFGRQNYNADGSSKNIPAALRPYADQKVALLPREFTQVPEGALSGPQRHSEAVALAEWDEDQHPREHGRFAPKGGDDLPAPHHDPASDHLHAGYFDQETDPYTGRPIPIQVKTVEDAIPLILAGKVVDVPDVASVHTLIDKLADMAKDAQAKGEKAPNYNLCNVSVGGSNFFCAGEVRTKDFPNGVPRISMPQLGGEPVPGSRADALPRNAWNTKEVDGGKAFAAAMQAQGIKVTTENVPVASLKASQNELIGQKVAGLMNNPHLDLVGNPIYVSKDNYVIDGHHRWAAAVGRESATGHLGRMQVPVVRVDAPITEVLHLANRWSSAFGIKQAAGLGRVKGAKLFHESVFLDDREFREPRYGVGLAGEWDEAQHPRGAGGKFGPGDSDSHKTTVTPADVHNQIQDIVAQGQFAHYGVRVDSDPANTVGSRAKSSADWTNKNSPHAIGGTAAVNVSDWRRVANYSGDNLLLLGSHGSSQGTDRSEIVMPHATVLAAWKLPEGFWGMQHHDIQLDDWDESKHPREHGGRFGSKGGDRDTPHAPQVPSTVSGTLFAKGLNPTEYEAHAQAMMQTLDAAHTDDPTWHANVAAVRETMSGFPMIHTAQLGNIPDIEKDGLLPAHAVGAGLEFDKISGLDRTVFMRMGQAGGGGHGAVGVMIDPTKLNTDNFIVTKLGAMTLKQDEQAFLKTPGDHQALVESQLRPYRDSTIPYKDLADVQSRLLVHGYEKDHPEARGTAIDPARIISNDHGEMEVKYADRIPSSAIVGYFAGDQTLSDKGFGGKSAYEYLKGKVPDSKLVKYHGEGLHELSTAYRAYYGKGRKS